MGLSQIPNNEKLCKEEGINSHGATFHTERGQTEHSVSHHSYLKVLTCCLVRRPPIRHRPQVIQVHTEQLHVELGIQRLLLPLQLFAQIQLVTFTR